MLLKSQKNITDFLVGTNAATSATALSGFAAGNWGFFAHGSTTSLNTGAALTAAAQGTNVDRICLVYERADGTHYRTPYMKPSKLSYKTQVYSAPAEQISYIGYVGSGTETIEAIDNNDYLVRVLIKGITAQYGDKMMYKFGAYRSSASATMREVALGLASNLTTNFKRERLFNGEQLIKFEVLTETAAGTNDMDNTVTVANGDTVVNVAVAANYGGGTPLVVGDYLRFDSIGGATPGPTDGVYKITAISGLVVTLDRPVEMPSGTYGATDVQAIPAATAAANSYWGIRCTGIDRSRWVVGTFNYEKVRFELQLQDCGTTIITESTRPTEGIGFYKEVAEMEWFFSGNRYNNGLRLGTPPPTYTMQTVVTGGTTYGFVILNYYDDSYDAINGTPKSPSQVIVAIPTANIAATATLLGTTWSIPAITV